ncbi:glycosyltransferase [Actinomycetospora straminea]|uniref:Glycosyltransferase 2-like domain-containing protein n=1 Tax=Actinomycetospora straminea TaxID=663607 RepID=A0ABP9E486_9PSEU|nr:glycosyltransferase [Actinomycetospora straminea]MDD7932732.1 glycosyltransferase [Actinomycetospora straminea]
MTVAVVVPVHRNAATLAALVDRVGAALAGQPWRVRLVVDACPEGSGDVARALAARDPCVGVSELAVNVGQHAALRRGLADERDATAWACLDADLQDPPEALPALLAALTGRDVVFAGRRGAYESSGRRLTGGVHRRLVAALTGLPRDAGAFLVLGPRARSAVLAAPGAPSVVVAVGPRTRAGAGLRVASRPVVRAARAVGTSAWTSRARARQSLRTLRWCVRQRTQR